VELSVVEQRYHAVMEVLAGGVPVTEVAERYGVSRQSVHTWIRRYQADELGGLSDRSHRPAYQPRQLAAEVEAQLVGMRRAHPRWGPRRLLFELVRAGVDPVPSRSTVYRLLVRHQLVTATSRRRRRPDFTKSYELIAGVRSPQRATARSTSIAANSSRDRSSLLAGFAALRLSVRARCCLMAKALPDQWTQSDLPVLR
jgi:transposase